jgi:DNA adenine methylase
MLQIKDNLASLLPGVKIQKPVLYYMGGKAKAVKQILSLIPSNIKSLVSPFLGGGAIELAIQSVGVETYAFDIFEPLMAYWYCQTSSKKDALADKVEKYTPMTRELYKELLGKLNEVLAPIKEGEPVKQYPVVDVAATYFALNRTAFMSQIWGGISTNPKNMDLTNVIKRVREFNAPKLHVDTMGFEESIEFVGHSSFLYLDPPYYIAKGTKYYGNDGDLGVFDHEKLSKILHSRGGWVLSYDNVPEVRELYSEYRKIIPSWTYSNATGSYESGEKEIIILSNDLPEVVDE